MSIRKKRSLLHDFIIIISLLLLTLTLFFVYRIHSVESKALEEGLVNISVQMNHNIIESFDNIENVLTYMGQQLSRHKNAKDYEYILELFRSFSNNPKILEPLSWTLVSWVNSDNKLVVDARLGILDKDHLKDVSGQAHLESARKKQWEMFLAQPIRGNTSKKWIIPAAIGVSDINGDYIGSFIFGFDIEKLKQHLIEITSGKQVEFALLDENSNIITSSRNDILIDSEILKNLDFNILSSQKISKINLFSGSGSFAYKLEKYPYAIYFKYGEGALFTGLMKALRENALEIILSFMILAIITIYFSKMIVLPVKQLANAVKSISKGNNNVEIPRVISSEFFSLAVALVRMKRYRRRYKLAQENLERTYQDAYNAAYDALGQETEKLNESQQQLLKTNEELKQANLHIGKLIEIHKDSDREKEIFLRDMYHTLNTPLQAIINGADIARNELLGPLKIDTYKKCFDSMYEAGMQLKYFTTEFIYPEAVDIKELIDKCVKIQNKYASSNNIELVNNVPENIPAVLVDKLRFRQVILSALYHSMSDVPDGGKAEISADVQHNEIGVPEFLLIRVADNGWGHSEKIREDFWKEKYGSEAESYSRNPDVTKLSLATIKHFMRLHNGSFTLEKLPESGTLFTIKLPYLQKHHGIVDSDSGKSRKPRKRKESNVVDFGDYKKS